MDAVLTTGETLGWDEDNLRREYFSAPEHDEYENFPFKVKIASTGKTIDVPAEKSLAEVLEENHIPVITKCNDGICGVCSTRYIEGDVEHRDFVLSRDERREHLITCCSRVTPESEQVLVLDR
jgi:ferredoxin